MESHQGYHQPQEGSSPNAHVQRALTKDTRKKKSLLSRVLVGRGLLSMSLDNSDLA
jgi:hypothetical protein